MDQHNYELHHKNVELAARINALLKEAFLQTTSSWNGIEQLQAKIKVLGSNQKKVEQDKNLTNVNNVNY